MWGATQTCSHAQPSFERRLPPLLGLTSFKTGNVFAKAWRGVCLAGPLNVLNMTGFM